MICSTPRSGSTLLCKMLEATNIAGRPGSHFHVPSLERWLTVYDLNDIEFSSRRDALGAVFKAAIARGMGGTNVFGLRMQRESFDYFMQQLALHAPGQMSDSERIGVAFGPTLFIHLSRPDRVGQAISRLRAEQTGLWHRRADGTELERLKPPQAAHYDAGAIARYMAEQAGLDEAWERWFEREGLTPLRLSYEALASDPQQVLAEVLSGLGLDPAVARSVEVPTAKLADEESQKWRKRFAAERESRL
jgi:LPS sulfotransferase NodH